MLFNKNISEGLFDQNEDWFNQVFTEYYLSAERGIGSTLLYFELHGVSISFSPKIEKETMKKEFLLGEIFYAYKSIINDGQLDNRLLNNIYIDVFDEQEKYNNELLIIFSHEGLNAIKEKMENYLERATDKITQAELQKRALLAENILKLNNFFKQKKIDCNFLDQKSNLAEQELMVRTLKNLKTVIDRLGLTAKEYKLLPGFNFVIATKQNAQQAKIIFNNNMFTVKTSVSREDLSRVLNRLLAKRRESKNNVKKFEDDLVSYIATTPLLSIETEIFIKLIPQEASFIKKLIMFYHPDRWHQKLSVVEKNKLTEITQKLTEKLASCKTPK